MISIIFYQKMNRSEIFNIMINGESSFAEKKERKVKVPFSSKAVEMLVKYIYGIELEEYQSLDIQSSVSTHNLDIFLELIEIWGIYGIENLDKAVTEKIKQHVNKENVFHIFSFSHLHKTDDLKKICTEKIISQFSERAVLEQKEIIDCPEMAVELWKLFEDKKKKCHENSETSSEDNMASYYNFSIFYDYLRQSSIDLHSCAKDEPQNCSPSRTTSNV